MATGYHISNQEMNDFTNRWKKIYAEAQILKNVTDEKDRIRRINELIELINIHGNALYKMKRHQS